MVRSSVLVWSAIGCLIGCSVDDPVGPADDDRPVQPIEALAPTESGPAPRFTNAALIAGIAHTYFNDAVPDRYFMPEITGGGAAWLDFDRDGWYDLYLAGGARLLDDEPPPPGAGPKLYRNRGDGTFADVTAAAGIPAGDFGQGVAAGDFNADGFPDLFLANYGRNRLLVNQGDGTFRSLRSSTISGPEDWSTSALWIDLNSDDHLDLVAVNYIRLDATNHRVCEYNGNPGYCGPGTYDAVPDQVLVNQGDGTFRDGAEEWNLHSEGKGLAIAGVDLDDDLRPEIYVANDLTPNSLFVRSEEGPVRYRDRAIEAGCAWSGDGAAEASMGIACADFDEDGRSDLFLTHYFQAKNTLYRNRGDLIFSDDSFRSRVAATSFLFLGFGTVPLDYDLDGSQDLFVANGHVLGPLQSPDAMRPQLLRNDGAGRFADISARGGPYFHDLWLGRGVAACDYDNDGDEDVVVTHLLRPCALLRNDTGERGNWIGLEFNARNRQYPAGGRVIVQADGRSRVYPIVAGGSYLSTNDPRMIVGLGAGSLAESVVIYWPGGGQTRLDEVEANRWYRVNERTGSAKTTVRYRQPRSSTPNEGRPS